MKTVFVILMLAVAGAGCTTKSTVRLKEQNAFLAGQNAALRQQQQQQQPSAPGVTVIGPVQNPNVPWVAGLTLAQAIATADYLDSRAPIQIIITRGGESAAMDAKVLLNGTDIPLEIGDVIELR
jgi:hypothetical protein